MPEPLFVGTGLPRDASELVVPTGAAVQPDYIRACADAHERSGFDSVVVGESSSSPDAMTIAAHLLGASDTLGVVVSVRAGLIAPTYAARALASLDAMHPGRVAVHLPDVISDDEPVRDGDWADRGARQRRRAEFAELAHLAWTADRPIEHAGEFYRVSGAWSAVRPARALPLWVSGASPASDELAGRLGDVYLLPRESPRELVARMHAVRSLAGTRAVRFGLRLRPIVRPTASGAAAVADRVLRVRPGPTLPRSVALPAISGALDGFGPLIGTAEDVAATLRRYGTLGIDVFQLSGYEPIEDAARYADVIEKVRAGKPRLLAGA